MRNSKSTLLYKWFNEAWNNDNESAIEKLMTTDSYDHSILTEDQSKGAE